MPVIDGRDIERYLFDRVSGDHRWRNSRPRPNCKATTSTITRAFWRSSRRTEKMLAVDLSRRVPGEALKAEFEGSLRKLEPLLERVRKTDELIDAMVYRLYALTEDEIGIVEGNANQENAN